MWKVTPQADLPSRARDREYQAIMPLKGKILNTWEVSSDEVLASQEVHDISVAIGIDPDSDDLSQLRYGKNPVSSRMRTLMVCTLPRCSALCS
ncbi:topoisomerase IV subunit B [Escherichia coli]|uniref:DNA topoisomerase (ATP-hydrolyzing) n=1 Tax=Escherichia coli TaxID=562 RepID=A0A2X1N845_ECOLX|nr:topoisomerase IV subunit B [Escherichia coli]